MDKLAEVINYFPYGIKQCIQEFSDDFNLLEEIRIRVDREILLKIGQVEYILNYIVSSKEILEILQKICDNSIYTYQNQICNGYITIKGGHRVGITGSIVFKEGQVINISHIYSLNFRIAKEIIGCSNKILKYILNIKENTVFNSIILSPPGRGKTTLLRDCVRNISDGIEEIGFKGINVGVVDERGEIAAMYKGIPQNDLGKRTDILDNVSKDIGMKMLIRSMNPNVIVADEIGTAEDVLAINYAVCSGIKGIFTAHGSTLNDIILNPILKKLYEIKVIEKIILIEKDRSLKLLYSKY
jgi:stage III sporulation protein AA